MLPASVVALRAWATLTMCAAGMRHMARGAAPRELGPRGQVSVEMVDKRGEDYDEPGHPSGSAQR